MAADRLARHAHGATATDELADIAEVDRGDRPGAIRLIADLDPGRAAGQGDEVADLGRDLGRLVDVGRDDHEPAARRRAVNGHDEADVVDPAGELVEPAQDRGGLVDLLEGLRHRSLALEVELVLEEGAGIVPLGEEQRRGRDVLGDHALGVGDLRGSVDGRSDHLARERVALDPGAGGEPVRDQGDHRLVQRGRTERAGHVLDGREVGLHVEVGPGDLVPAERGHRALERLRGGEAVLAAAVDGRLDRGLVADEEHARGGRGGDLRTMVGAVDRQRDVLVGLLGGRRPGIQRLQPGDRRGRVLLGRDEQVVQVVEPGRQDR